jgi:hypothetical protein
MNFFQIISEIEKVDPEVYDRLDSRRAIFKNMAGLGKKLSAAALPLAVGAVFNKVYAQTPAGLAVNDVLNFALKLEYLEMFFYQQRTLVTSFSSTTNAALALIGTDETNHVNFLRGVLGNAAITAPTLATFDFTAKGAFNPADATTYLTLAQALEDTGVRAYKGAAPLSAVMANKTVLTAALNIHSVEARHASHIRAIRRAASNGSAASVMQGVPVAPYTTAPKSWVSGTDSNPVVTARASASNVYGAGVDSGAATYGSANASGTNAGVIFYADSNVTQGAAGSNPGVVLSGSTLTAASAFPAAAFSEAFDEGLDVGTVASIANNFSVSGSYFG